MTLSLSYQHYTVDEQKKHFAHCITSKIKLFLLKFVLTNQEIEKKSGYILIYEKLETRMR